MKIILVLLLSLTACTLFAGNLDSVTVSFKDTSFTLKIGDELKTGYGKDPYGSFRFIYTGGNPRSYLEKNGGGKTGSIKKIKEFPRANMLQVFLKIPGFGTKMVDIREAIDVGEIIGHNGWMFNKEQ